jgi:hypothetical protein
MGKKVSHSKSMAACSRRSYTTPPGRSPGSPLAKEHSAADTPLPFTPRHGSHLDVQAKPGADLARGKLYSVANLTVQCMAPSSIRLSIILAVQDVPRSCRPIRGSIFQGAQYAFRVFNRLTQQSCQGF